MNPTIPYGILLKTIEEVETGSLPESKREGVYGDNGNAFGPLQIHRACHTDAMERAFSDTWTKRYWPPYRLVGSRVFSQVVFYLYMHRYANKELMKMDVPSCVKMARVWNGGPMGYRKKATEEYGRKFLEILAKNMDCDPIIFMEYSP